MVVGYACSFVIGHAQLIADDLVLVVLRSAGFRDDDGNLQENPRHKVWNFSSRFGFSLGCGWVKSFSFFCSFLNAVAVV